MTRVVVLPPDFCCLLQHDELFCPLTTVVCLQHDELVLLLIQLRRDKADLTEQRDRYRKALEKLRLPEFYYKKL